MPEPERINQFEPSFDEEEVKEVTQVLESGWIAEGKKTREFEKAYADFVGARYAVATNSGSMALYIALLAADIGAGDEVIVPDLTFIATANAVKLTGATPVFADVNRNNFTIAVERVERLVTEKTSAVIPVHLNGRPADLKRLQEVARKHELTLIEDAAQALGSKLDGKYLGTFGKYGCFSLATTKIITTGQGGIVLTDSPGIDERLRRIKDHGRLNKDDYHPSFGFNFRMTDVQAAIGIAQMRKLEKRLKRIKKAVELYRDNLKSIKEISFISVNDETQPWYADLFSDKAASLHEFLAKKQIMTRPYYTPLHMQPAYKHQGQYPNAEYAHMKGLFLPSSSFLTDEQIDYVCKEIRSFFL